MKNIDWPTIQRFYDSGKNYREITKSFGIANLTLVRATKRGDFKPRDRNDRRLGKHREKNCSICKSILPDSRMLYCSDKCATLQRNKVGSTNSIEWRQKHKLALVKAFGGVCGICHIEDHPAIYDFHHLDPKQKDFSIGRGGRRRWEDICAEVSKCVMLCSNCHRKHHHGGAEIPEGINRFNQSSLTP